MYAILDFKSIFNTFRQKEFGMNYKPRAKSEIILEFTRHILKVTPGSMNDFKHWCIGISNDVEKIKTDKGSLSGLMIRKSQTPRNAREIEEYFLMKGMQNMEISGSYPTYVFIHILS